MKQAFEQKGIELQTSTENINGWNIHYAKTGYDTLPAIVFIHGTPGSWNAFADYMQDKELLQKFRMISIDRPGFGYSDFGKAINLQQQTELLVPLLQKIHNNKPMFLVGHSLGGPLVIKMAAVEPELFDGLIIISGSVDPAAEKPEKWRPVFFKTPLNFLVPGAFRPSNEELWYLKNDLVEMKPDFAKVVCPVYFIHGDKDSWVPPGNVAYAKTLLVNAKKVYELMLPGGNHFIPWTKYEEIKSVLMRVNNGL